MSPQAAHRPPITVFAPAEFAKMMQREVSKFVEQANQSWMARAELEQDLFADLWKSLSTALSLPDAVAAYQAWLTRRAEIMAEDVHRLFDEVGSSWVLPSSHFRWLTEPPLGFIDTPPPATVKVATHQEPSARKVHIRTPL